MIDPLLDGAREHRAYALERHFRGEFIGTLVWAAVAAAVASGDPWLFAGLFAGGVAIWRLGLWLDCRWPGRPRCDNVDISTPKNSG